MSQVMLSKRASTLGVASFPFQVRTQDLSSQLTFELEKSVSLKYFFSPVNWGAILLICLEDGGGFISVEILT